MEDLTQQPPLESRPTPPLSGSRDLFDINILPDRFRRKKLTLMGLLPWLILIILLGSIYPTYNLATLSQGTFQDNRLALARVQADLDFYQSNSQEQEELQSQLDDAMDQKEAIIQSYGGLQFSSQKWNPTLFQINQLLPEGVSWTQISQQNETIRLDGIATEYQLVIDLLDSLKSLDSLEVVEIESIEQIESEETLTTPPEGEDDQITPSEVPPIIYSFTILAITAGEVQP